MVDWTSNYNLSEILQLFIETVNSFSAIEKHAFDKITPALAGCQFSSVYILLKS